MSTYQNLTHCLLIFSQFHKHLIWSKFGLWYENRSIKDALILSDTQPRLPWNMEQLLRHRRKHRIWHGENNPKTLISILFICLFPYQKLLSSLARVWLMLLRPHSPSIFASSAIAEFLRDVMRVYTILYYLQCPHPIKGASGTCTELLKVYDLKQHQSS